MQQGLLKALLADDSLLMDITNPDVQSLIYYRDTTMTNTEIGKIAQVGEHIKLNEIAQAISKNNQIDPKTCIEDYHKQVPIFFMIP